MINDIIAGSRGAHGPSRLSMRYESVKAPQELARREAYATAGSGLSNQAERG